MARLTRGYAWVLTANGYTYLVNIDPVLRQFSAVLQQGDVFVANATETEQTPFVNSLIAWMVGDSDFGSRFSSFSIFSVMSP